MIKIPEIDNSIKRLRIDIGLSYDAPNSQEWLQESNDIFVFGFEPVPENCRNVLETIKNDRFHLYEYAVSDTAGIKIFNVTKHSKSIEKDRGQSSFYEPSDKCPFSTDFKIEVNCITLDGFLSLIDWSRFDSIDFLKIDAQGHDLEIIKSTKEHINKLPLIKLESTTQGEYVGTPQDHNPNSMYEFMHNNGYSLAQSLHGDHIYSR